MGTEIHPKPAPPTIRIKTGALLPLNKKTVTSSVRPNGNLLLKILIQNAIVLLIIFTIQII